jgi:hypothetical protein
MEDLRNRPDLNLECFSEVTPKEEKVGIIDFRTKNCDKCYHQARQFQSQTVSTN